MATDYAKKIEKKIRSLSFPKKTTISINVDSREKLKTVKKYPRETFDDTIQRLVQNDIKANLRRKLRERK